MLQGPCGAALPADGWSRCPASWLFPTCRGLSQGCRSWARPTRGVWAWCSAPPTITPHWGTLARSIWGGALKGWPQVVLQPDACFRGQACVVGSKTGQLPRTAWPVCSPARGGPRSGKVILGLAGLVGAEPPQWFWIWVVPGGTCLAGNTTRPSSGSWVTALAWPPRLGAGHKGTVPPGPGPRPRPGDSGDASAQDVLPMQLDSDRPVAGGAGGRGGHLG